MCKVYETNINASEGIAGQKILFNKMQSTSVSENYIDLILNVCMYSSPLEKFYYSVHFYLLKIMKTPYYPFPSKIVLHKTQFKVYIKLY